MHYDIIGDIHGHADKLERLLNRLGYRLHKGIYTHPEKHLVLFVGDFIDRGPKIRETLHIVKNMVDSGNALAVMGNHEYNAVCFHTPNTDKEKGFFRKHTIVEIEQHIETLRQFRHYPDEWKEFIEWFKVLPMYLDLPECRVVHAFWSDANVEWLKANYTKLDKTFLEQSTVKGTKAYKVVEDTLKGVEQVLPHGFTFDDKDGNTRKECRIKWWADKVDTLQDVLMECPLDLVNAPIEFDFSQYTYSDPKPLFFGHYWLKGFPPKHSSTNAFCLDYSIAKGGVLVAASLKDGVFSISYV